MTGEGLAMTAQMLGRLFGQQFVKALHLILYTGTQERKRDIACTQ